MKTQILKTIKGLTPELMNQLLSFIMDEDLDFIVSMEFSTDEMFEKTDSFFSSKDDVTIKLVAKDMLVFNEKLHNTIFSKKESGSKKPNKSEIKESLTPNQVLVMNKIRKMIEKSANGKIRTDSIEIKEKSKFFLGGVITTLVEKKLISVEILDKKKFVNLVQKQ